MRGRAPRLFVINCPICKQYAFFVKIRQIKTLECIFLPSLFTRVPTWPTAQRIATGTRSFDLYLLFVDINDDTLGICFFFLLLFNIFERNFLWGALKFYWIVSNSKLNDLENRSFFYYKKKRDTSGLNLVIAQAHTE